MTKSASIVRFGKKLMYFLNEFRNRKNERLNASLSAIRSAEQARYLAGRINDNKGK